MYLSIPLPKEIAIFCRCSNIILYIPSEALWNTNDENNLNDVVKMRNNKSDAQVQGLDKIFSSKKGW